MSERKMKFMGYKNGYLPTEMGVISCWDRAGNHYIRKTKREGWSYKNGRLVHGKLPDTKETIYER